MKRLFLLTLVALGSEASAQEKKVEKVGNWEVQTTSDSFTDSVRGVAHTPLGQTGTIVVKCDKPGPGSMYVEFLTPSFLGSDSIARGRYHEAQYRLDDGPPGDLPGLYYDGKSAILLQGKKRANFITEITVNEPKRLRVQFVSYDGSYANVDLDVEGAGTAMKKTAAICSDTSTIAAGG